MQLSKRLKTIIDLVEPCELVYDLCCDHGLIGLNIYSNKISKNVIFNDQVDSIINKLEDKICDIYSYIPLGIDFLKKPAKEIKFKNKSTIVLVGIGYGTIIRILPKIPQDCIIILSSHTKALELRSYLNNKYELLDEVLVEENDKYYEILKISTSNQSMISDIGNFPKNEVLQSYLLQLHDHHQKKASLGNDAFSKEILKSILLKQKEF